MFFYIIWKSVNMESAAKNLIVRHPLQRFDSPSRGVSALVHICGIVSFTLSYKYLIDYPSPINDSYGWHWQYLTILGLTVAYATFIFGLLADITLSPKLFLIKNTLSLCSAPLEVLISVLYWGISAIDKTLVVPPELHMAPVADIGFHAMPSILLVIDLLFLSPPWTMQAFPVMALSSGIAVAYWAWVEHCFKYNGFYPYPLFEVLDTSQRTVLFAGAAMMMSISTAVLQWLYGKINGLQVAEKRSTPANIKGE